MYTPGAVSTYDPGKVVLTFGAVPISGFADGTFIKVKGSTERFKRVVGASGEVARARSNDDTYEVEITLLASSLSNGVMNGFAETDRLTNMGALPLSITDLSTGKTLFWPQAWIKSAPDLEFGKEVGSITWTLETGQIAANLITGDTLPG